MTYRDIIRQIKDVVGSRTAIVRISFRLFWRLLRTYAVFDPDPRFTARQLEALVIPESFAISTGQPWGCTPIPLRTAIEQTFRDPTYSQVILES
jgi:hypothetical protein